MDSKKASSPSDREKDYLEELFNFNPNVFPMNDGELMIDSEKYKVGNYQLDSSASSSPLTNNSSTSDEDLSKWNQDIWDHWNFFLKKKYYFILFLFKAFILKIL